MLMDTSVGLLEHVDSLTHHHVGSVLWACGQLGLLPDADVMDVGTLGSRGWPRAKHIRCTTAFADKHVLLFPHER